MNKKLDWSQGNILAYEFKEKVEEEEYKNIVNEVENTLDHFETIRIFVRMPNMVSAEFTTLDDRLKFLKDNDMERIERYAIVGDQKTLMALTKGADIMTGANLRFFEFDEEAKAKEWVLEQG
ncbi:STAS/SEC14 domain-containing protein [Salsuginibacillus kocurii]|uniref:STAS/SEC14 domain-containing protein n=1 Tax=Salsuginibacillus kocurii TaxID=427078 RepID=UPI00035D2314|nr:STAS/SEC14 domain-containing protein [Salsuginibacillus kocurii]